jgi:hypothetical protein
MHHRMHHCTIGVQCACGSASSAAWRAAHARDERDYCGASQLGALLEQAHARIAHVEAQCIEAELAKTHMETTAAALACEADRLSQEVSRATQPLRGCARSFCGELLTND